MPELLEAVSMAVSSESHDEDCYFCNAKKEPVPELNEFEEDPTDDGPVDGGLKFKNDASKLGRAIGGCPDEKTIKLKADDHPVSVAAHHLIPGNASLKKSDLFKSNKYLWKDGKVNGNIGYNINSSPNGVWLPGNYACRPWGTNGAAFTSRTSLGPEVYAFAAIKAWSAQFHDAHEDYSTFVTDVLDKIFQKLEKSESIWCPQAKKEDEDDPEKKKPLYILVNRLHTVSARMRRMLVFPTSNWKKNIWTSRFSLQYINALSKQT
jgi:hypothetical protein